MLKQNKSNKKFKKLNSKDRTQTKTVLTKLKWNYKAKHNLLENESATIK